MHRPINAQTILEPCTNLEAGLRVEFVKYNGNPPPDRRRRLLDHSHGECSGRGCVGCEPHSSSLPPAPPEEVVLDDRPAWNDDEPQTEGK